MCPGFGTEGVKISLWGLEDVHLNFMGQHLHKFVSDIGCLLLKCHIVPACTCFQETLVGKTENPAFCRKKRQFLA